MSALCHSEVNKTHSLQINYTHKATEGYTNRQRDGQPINKKTSKHTHKQKELVPISAFDLFSITSVFSKIAKITHTHNFDKITDNKGMDKDRIQ